MADIIVTIRPTTELEAVNVMLGAIGEAPLAAGADLTALSADDANVEQAVNILRETVREVLAAGWRFNTLTGYELAPEVATHSWVDTDGQTTTINIFKVPDDWLAWLQTPCSEMRGLDLIERRSLQYEETGSPVMVLFDRAKNRDGAEASVYPFLYLDPVFSVNFTDMPECARRYATVVAARRLAERVPVSQIQAAFSEKAEYAALRVLKREQGEVKPLNLFHTGDAYETLGRRPYGGGGYNARVFPGGT